jgi:hypothetical protein
MTNPAKTFKKIYRKSASEKLQELLGVLICVGILIIIVAGILGVDLL